MQTRISNVKDLLQGVDVLKQIVPNQIDVKHIAFEWYHANRALLCVIVNVSNG